MSKNIFFHITVRYPFIKSFEAIKSGNVRYLPFFLFYGFSLFLSFIPEYLHLIMKRPEHANYPPKYS